MGKHISKNFVWIKIGVEEFIIGLLMLLQYQNFDARLPSVLGMFGSPIAGFIYVLIGVVMVVNFIWDFYWYRIRLALIIFSGAIFGIITSGYFLNDYFVGKITAMPYFLLIASAEILFNAWKEPRHKLGGKKHG